MSKDAAQFDISINRIGAILLFLTIILIIIAVPFMVDAYNKLVGWQNIAVFVIQMILLFYAVKVARNSAFIERLLN